VDTPAVLVLAALAFAAYGIRSRFAVIGWYLFGLALFLTELGAALQLTQWVRDLSPFQHVPQCLVHGGPSWVGAVVLLGVALVVVEVGQWCLRRRDIG
jgi:ABC-2 type transport system permease protein